MAKRRALILLSGGIDSAACAHFYLERTYDVSAVHVQYGQAASKSELRSAKKIAHYLDLPLKVCRFSSPKKFTQGEVASRNSFLLFSAILATQRKSGVIGMGIHSGTSYYDCSTAFESAAGRLVSEQSDGKLKFALPFLSWTKLEVFEYFKTNGLQASMTYSCESRSSAPCGRCSSCRDRRALGC